MRKRSARDTCVAHVHWLAVAVQFARPRKKTRVTARRDADAFQSIGEGSRLPGFGRDLGQLPWEVGAESVLELDHELVAGVHGVSLGACLDFEGQRVATIVPGRLLEANEAGNARDRTNVGVGLGKRSVDLERDGNEEFHAPDDNTKLRRLKLCEPHVVFHQMWVGKYEAE